MEKHAPHITSYINHLKILVFLIIMTSITITITVINLSTWTIAVALIIAAVKGAVVMAYFMHLKFETAIFRWFAIGVIVLLATVIFLTFSDYLFR